MTTIIIGFFSSHLADCGQDHFVAMQTMADGPF